MITSSPPKVLVHPDYLRLEDELATRIRRLQDSGTSLTPILVTAPSERMVQRLREALAAHLGATAGVECLHYQALAYRILADGEDDPPTPGSSSLQEALVRRILLRSPDSPLVRYGRSRPGAIRALTRLLTELRESGIDAEALGGRPPAVAALLCSYETAIRELLGTEPPGWGDRAEMFRRARARAPERTPFRAVFAYGAYELVGINLDLLQALPSEDGVTFLVPADPDAPAWGYARDFIARHLGSGVTHLPEKQPGLFVRAARCLWGPETTGENPGKNLSLIDVQGPEAELTTAARLALAWIDAGVPPWEIGIVARTLDPYVPLAESVFERHRLPVDASLSLPLSRFPAIRGFLLLLRVLGREFERQPVIEFVRSPVFRRPELPTTDLSGWRPGAWDQWSRAYGIARGAEGWTTVLPGLLQGQSPPPWVREDPEELQRFEKRRISEADSARVLGGIIDRLVREQETWRECRTGEEHRLFLEGLGERWIRELAGDTRRDPPTEAAASAWKAALAELQGLHALERIGTPSAKESGLDLPQVLDFVELALEERRIPWKHPNGVRFLDFRQVRGLSFRHLVVTGFNDGLVPNRPREAPFFPDEARDQLRTATGKPIPLRREAGGEERLLFAQTVAAARESLTLLWQRADAEGKARAPSPYLREILRTFSADGALPGARSSVPAHPARSAEWFQERTGMLTREEAATLASDSSQNPAAAVEEILAELEPELARELAPNFDLIRHVERFESPDLSYDGRVSGEDVGDPSFSATSLKALGTCPQTFFFQYVLGIKPLRDITRDYRLDGRELGTHVHGLLEKVYADLIGQGLLEGDTDPGPLIAAGNTALEKHWKTLIEPLGRRLGKRFPLLFQCTQEIWREETERFLKKDLARMAEGGYSRFSLETPWRNEITVSRETGDAMSLTLVGIADRVSRNEAGTWLISDYKTGGKPEKWITAPKMLRLQQVQLPVYVLLAEAAGMTGKVDSEVLGLGPSFFPDRGFVRDDPVVLEHETFEDYRESFLESMAVLGGMAGEGKYPFQVDYHCTWCAFATACRKNHYPSRKRVENEPEYLDYYLTQKKSSRKHARYLADLRKGS